MCRVIVLQASPPGHAAPEWERVLLQRLPYARRLELESRDPQARRMSLVGLRLLFEAAGQLGCGGVGPDHLRFPEGGKPRLAGGPYFSISHTTQRVACAASVDCDVGLDHEEVTGRDAPARLRHWTAIEATLKAAGAGLARAADVAIDADLSGSRLDGARYHLVSLDLGSSAVACLASRTRPEAVEIRSEGLST